MIRSFANCFPAESLLLRASASALSSVSSRGISSPNLNNSPSQTAGSTSIGYLLQASLSTIGVNNQPLPNGGGDGGRESPSHHGEGGGGSFALSGLLAMGTATPLALTQLPSAMAASLLSQLRCLNSQAEGEHARSGIRLPPLHAVRQIWTDHQHAIPLMESKTAMVL